jgi:hypothetical protein
MISEKIRELEERRSRLEEEHSAVLEEIAKLKYSRKDELLEELKEKFVGKWAVIDEGDSGIEIMLINSITPFSGSDTENFILGGYDVYMSRTRNYYMCGEERNTYTVSDLNEMRLPSADEVGMIIGKCRDGFNRFIDSAEKIG